MDTINSQIATMETFIEEAASSTSSWRVIELEYGNVLHQLRQAVYAGNYDMENYMQGKLSEMDEHFKRFIGVKAPSLAPELHRGFARSCLKTFKNNIAKAYKTA